MCHPTTLPKSSLSLCFQILNISVPGGATQPSSFAYGAPLPTVRLPAPSNLSQADRTLQYIINRPADPNAVAYGYGQPPAGVPMTGVPLYNQFDEKIPGYNAPPPGLYVPNDTKNERESLV